MAGPRIDMRRTYSRSELMKRNSRSLITYCVSRVSEASRAQIAEATGLSRAHVHDVVDELVSEGELIETGSVSAGRGRPTTLLQVNPNSICAGGVWLAEDSIEVGIAGATGDIVARGSLSYSGDPLADLDAIVEAVGVCVEQSGKSTGSMRGVGVVVAGLVDPALGLIRGTTHDHGFAGVPIVQLLRERLDVPVFADTDIRAAALADHWDLGGGDRVLYLSFCDGIGAAFVYGHELFGGASGCGLGIGHVPVDRDGRQCYCGKQGCLEAYTSNYAFIRRLWPDVALEQLAPPELRNMVREGVEMALQGDCDAVAAMSEIAEYIGLGVSIAVNVLDPRVVCVAGTLMDYAADQMMEMVRREAMRQINVPFRGVEIRSLTRLNEFEFKGAFGLVLLNQFRALNKDINAKLMFPYSPSTS